MNVRIKYVLLLVTFAVAEKQIKLEDIERDNLLSERRVNRDEETVKIGQSQHLTAPIHVGPSYEASSEGGGNDLGETDIVYAQPAVASASGEQYGKPEQQTSIQYVTPNQFEKDYEAKPTAASYIHPVHEATHTYSAPARQSLINPIIYKPAASQSPYLSQQPKFVYVQAGPQQVSQSGVITYGQAQHSAENIAQTQQKNAQDDISYAPIEQNQLLDTSQQAVNAPTRQPGDQASRALFYPVLAQTSSLPNYIMVFRNPSHAQAYAMPSIQYAQSALVGPGEAPVPQQHLTAPQSPLAASFVSPTIDTAAAVLPAPDSTAIPHATLQYAVPSQLQYAPQALHLQPAVDYVAPQLSHQLHHSQPYYPSPYTSPVDIFHSLHKHHPTSLLDSYIPSSVILAAQRQRNSALINRQILHAVSGNFAASPAFHAHPTQFFHQGSHQPGYNTIAYSTAQGYSKRSPKLVTERPLKLNKRN